MGIGDLATGSGDLTRVFLRRSGLTRRPGARTLPNYGGLESSVFGSASMCGASHTDRYAGRIDHWARRHCSETSPSFQTSWGAKGRDPGAHRRRLPDKALASCNGTFAGRAHAHRRVGRAVRGRASGTCQAVAVKPGPGRQASVIAERVLERLRHARRVGGGVTSARAGGPPGPHRSYSSGCPRSGACLRRENAFAASRRRSPLVARWLRRIG